MLRTAKLIALTTSALVAGVVGGSAVWAETPSLATKPSFAETAPTESSPATPGSLVGAAYGSDPLGGLPWGAPGAQFGIEVLDASGVVVGLTHTDAAGEFFLAGLPEGSYSITATEDATAAAVTVVLEIASDAVTRLNLVVDERSADRLVAFPAAFVVEDGAPSPDVLRDGQVDLEDLQFVRQNRGPADQPAREDDADLDDDGVIGDSDEDIVRNAFGRAVLPSGGLFAATVEPGGSICEGIDGTLMTSSVDGHTVGDLALLGGGVARFMVVQNSGLASSPQFGDFAFDSHPSSQSWIDVGLDDGRIIGGEMGLTLSGDAFGEPASALGSVGAGYVAFAIGGIENYRLVSVAGTLDLGGLSVPYTCDARHRRKRNVACRTTTLAAGSARCNLGGTACQTRRAKCAVKGFCGRCKDVTSSGIHWDPVGRKWVRGVKCGGCNCF